MSPLSVSRTVPEIRETEIFCFFLIFTYLKFRFACGYMKHPQHAMHILIKEHPEIVNNQRLVLQN